MVQGFGTDTEEVAAVASRIRRAAEPLTDDLARIEASPVGPETTGRAFARQGTAYREAIRARLVPSIRGYAAAVADLADRLAAGGRDYAEAEQSAVSRFRNAEERGGPVTITVSRDGGPVSTITVGDSAAVTSSASASDRHDPPVAAGGQQAASTGSMGFSGATSGSGGDHGSAGGAVLAAADADASENAKERVAAADRGDGGAAQALGDRSLEHRAHQHRDVDGGGAVIASADDGTDGGDDADGGAVLGSAPAAPERPAPGAYPDAAMVAGPASAREGDARRGPGQR